MQASFYNNPKFFGFYAGIWIIISLIQISVLHLQFNLSWLHAIADSFFYSYTLGLFYISIPYYAKYVKPGKPGLFNLVLNQFMAASLLVLFWILIVKNLNEYLFNESITYVRFSQQSVTWRVIFGYLMYGILVLLYFAEQNYSNLQQKTISETQLISANRQAELKMLKAQINPHFLFNSLNSISSLTLTDAPKAHKMVLTLADYFRYSISKSENQFSNVRVEIENCKKYLEIEQIRFGEKLKLEYTIDNESLNCQIPTMILQPLYENAVKYGVYESLNEVSIRTLISKKNDYVEIEIENEVEKYSRKRKGEGIGLKNVSDMLKLSYNSDNLLTVNQLPDKFVVNIKIPFKPE